MMEISRETIAGRTLRAAVYVAVVVLLAAGILLGLWTAEEMNAVGTEQFNAQQMTIAQTTCHRIEREIAAIRSELDLLARTLPPADSGPTGIEARMALVMERLAPLGLRRIHLTAQASSEGIRVTPSGAERVRLTEEDPPPASAPEGQALWTSPVRFGPEGRFLRFAALPPGREDLRIEFQVDVGALLASILGPIRSGERGYAWVIDAEGRFVFQPNPDFSGRNAFSVRDEKFPDLAHERIHFIQKERMLRGEEGTGKYESGWHHG